jgi:mitochondrial import inner membrane translocase subunit TIM17
VRRKEDPWNAIIAGFLTVRISLISRHRVWSELASKEKMLSDHQQGGSLAVRGGAKAMRNSAIGCAILLAVIEGVGIGFQRMMAENTALQPPPSPPQLPSSSQPALA